jgi:hypothetical protein
MFWFWIIILSLAFIGGIRAFYVIIIAKPKVFEEMPVIDERELDQYRTMLNDALIGDTKLWDDNDWDKYNELNEKYGSIVYTHFKPTTMKVDKPRKRLDAWENEWQGTISTSQENEQMRREYIERQRKEIKMFANAYFDDNTKQIIVEYGSQPYGHRAVAYFTRQEYDYITNEKFKDKFGADKPIYPKTILNDKNYQLPLV